MLILFPLTVACLRKWLVLFLQLLLFWEEDASGWLPCQGSGPGNCFPIDVCVSNSNGGIYTAAEHLINI